MEQNLKANGISPEAVVRTYVEAMKARDLARCLDLYADDAKLIFVATTFVGKKAIEEWHKERFAAELEIVRSSEPKSKGQSAMVDVVVTSRNLKNWKISFLGGRVQVYLDDGQIKETRISPRMINPFDSALRSGTS
jgi:hypothetical protein